MTAGSTKSGQAHAPDFEVQLVLGVAVGADEGALRRRAKGDRRRQVEGSRVAAQEQVEHAFSCRRHVRADVVREHRHTGSALPVKRDVGMRAFCRSVVPPAPIGPDVPAERHPLTFR